MATILLLHGPNLNLLGQREPHIYGTATLDDYVTATRTRAESHGHELEALQSNQEKLQGAMAAWEEQSTKLEELRAGIAAKNAAA